MTILRGLVKEHLVPSLNRVASHLITGMTGGQRQSVVVDEDFDVTVDGQALDTLSGSSKSVANLALRLGLGQVLTNKVFSLFIGDEIDASLDQDRSENCANTMQAVKSWVSQIILISHKTMPADYCIDLNTRLDVAPKHEASTLAANSYGQSWTDSGFRGSWGKLRAKLEQDGKVQPGLTIHGLRHTVATNMREEGFDERTIADALGQKTDSMARHYSRDADLSRKMTAVAERMDVAETKRRSEVVKPTLKSVKP